MARLTNRKLVDISRDAARYRWEFLRRNNDYAQKLEQLNVIMDAVQKISPENPEELTDAVELCKKSWIAFAKRWGFALRSERFPLPEKSFDELSESEKATLFPFATDPGWWSFHSVANLIASSKIKLINFPIYNKDTLASIKIEIKLDRPQRVIMGDLEYVIKVMKALRKRRGLKDAVKPRYPEYDDYLKIYDLRKKKKTFKEIAALVYKRCSPQGDARDQEDRAAKGYKRAEQLILSGYRNIW